MSKLITHPHIPTFDRNPLSFASYGTQGTSRNQISHIEPGERAANFMLHANNIARQVCMTIGKDYIADDNGAYHLLRISRGRCDDYAVDAVYQEVAKFLHFERTD